MKKLLLMLLLTFGFSAGIQAQSTPELYLTNIWARPTAFDEMSGMDEATEEAHMHGTEATMSSIPPSAIYMAITNPSASDVRLVSAETPFATIELHETTVENDVMQMRELEDGLTIPAGEQAVLEQGGLHIMLMGLTRELYPGDALPVTLNFEVVDSGEPFSIITAAPVLMEAPAPNDTIIISGAWARATLLGGMPAMDEHAMGEATEEAPMEGMNIPPSAVYMNIRNLGDDDLTLVAVQTDITETVEIHETAVENDVMRMRELEDGLSIPAGGNATLEQGGYHIMMMGLTRDLVAGDEVTDAIAVTLIFSDGTELSIGVPVLESADSLIITE